MKLCPKCQKQFPDDANFCPVDAARLIPLEAQASGQDSLATRFELGAKLGGSRTGAVHRATDKTTGTACVVKLVAPTVVALPGIAQRLERELRSLERVPSPGVAKVIASGKRGDETWVAMELVEGAHTLADAITARGPIPPPQAADLVECIGEALIEAAQVGVVHRDLAPKNILFAGGDVKLVNFSLPVPHDKTPGVAEFVAPEQVDGKPVDQRSNLYSLGAIYYYVLTGEAPVADAPKPPSQLVSSIAAGSPIENVIMRALDRSPTKRFLTVRQFIDEVNRIGRSEVIELDKPIAPAPKRPKAELVSTLMGVAKGGGALNYAIKATAAPAAPIVAAAPVVQMPAPIASAPTVGTGVPSVAPAAQPAPAAAAAPAQAPIVQTVVGMPASTQSSAPPDPRSPWAAPASAPAAATIVGSSPVAAAPAVVAAPAAPVVAAPVVAKKNAEPAASKEGGEKKGKFRETMWFKKGDLDTQAAIAAAEERARTGKDVANDKADSLPMDERYKDDGSITRGDKEKYSLRTGGTQMMQAVRGDIGAAAAKVSEDELIGEMKSGRRVVMIAIAIGVIAAIAIIVMLAS
ncbi:MAG TPA: serine/threonine-protein kinase [Kofleriaceae bacterium]|jgi:serine/threonine-protein kinase